MRFVVVGAGAVGGTVGALLHRSGHQVVLVARGAHARALRDGMLLRLPEEELRLHLPVADELQELAAADDDVYLFATKTQDTLPLLEELAAKRTETGAAAAASPVVCLQNGVENERLAARRFGLVYGVCVMLPATRLEPGVITASGTPYPGMLDVGRWPGGVDPTAEALAAAFSSAGFRSEADPAIQRWKYAKLLRNLGNAIEALVGDHPAALFRPVRAEGERILAAAGVDVADDDEWRERRGRSVEVAPGTRGGGSSWQSLVVGAGSIETDYLNGEITYLARSLGLSAPRNALLQQLARTAARSGARPGELKADELGELLDAAAAHE